MGTVRRLQQLQPRQPTLQAWAHLPRHMMWSGTAATVHARLPQGPGTDRVRVTGTTGARDATTGVYSGRAVPPSSVPRTANGSLEWKHIRLCMQM